ncbi:diacylglycerol kinase zeta isoform X7 [Silurus meridionalis]|nr:diacylglycerol kinase zeta isoform X7 [Silurus meridionalis]
MADDEGAESQEGLEGTTSLASTSASSSTSDLPCAASPGAERHAGGRRHSSRSFTGLRLFGRRDFTPLKLAQKLVSERRVGLDTAPLEHRGLRALLKGPRVAAWRYWGLNP